MSNSTEPSRTAHQSPRARIHRLAMGDATWTEGFWADRFALCRRVILPHMERALEHPDNAARLSNFRVAAGDEDGEHSGTFWSDGDCYKWLEAIAHVYAVVGDEALDRTMDHWVDLIARSQDPDGYISTQVQLDPHKQRWERRSHHELYNMGHLMTAAAVHFRATGKTTFLAVARKVGDYLYGTFAGRPAELGRFGFNPSQIMGLVDLHRATGEQRYLELAGIFIDMRGSGATPVIPWGRPGNDDAHRGDQNQDRVPLRQETQAVGHAVTATYLYAGAADVVAETGDTKLREALERIWHDVVDRKMYVTGAVGAYHNGVSVRHDKVHEAFGREYELPSATAYNETCANIGNAMWNLRMLELEGDARFADTMELVLYNSALSAMDVDGTRFCYTNPLARRQGTGMLSHDTAERWSEHTCYCCPPQVARTLAGVHEWAYGVSEEGLWVHIYGTGAVDTTLPGGARFGLTQTTDYPWDGCVRFVIQSAPEDEVALKLRIPGWSKGSKLSINGTPVDTALVPASYALLLRPWRAGDVIELDLPMPPRLVEANPNVETSLNQVAVMRGPVVYCLESADLPAGVPIDEVRVPRDVDLTPRWRPDLLGGVVVLEGRGIRRPGPDWTGRLYQDIEDTECEPIGLRLIPYYAWLNRGPEEMRVWLPLG